MVPSSSSSSDGQNDISSPLQEEDPNNNQSPPAAVLEPAEIDIQGVIDSVEKYAAEHSNRFSLRSSVSSSQNSNEEQELNRHINTNVRPIEADLYGHLVNGSKGVVLSQFGNLWELQTDRDKNSVLHIAALSGQDMLITDLIPYCKDIISWKNAKEDLALHTAARVGNLDVLRALTAWDRYVCDGGSIGRELLGVANKEGDTPLHIALEGNDEQMACFLVDKYGEACIQMNQRQECPLYLAVKAGYWKLVKNMIQIIKEMEPETQDTLLKGNSVVHAAIKANKIEIIDEIRQNLQNLIESVDELGRTPLSYASFKGNLKVVRYLLSEFPSSAFKCDEDEDGSFPIHKAASGGHIDVIRALYCTKKLPNRRGQNILHMAAASGQSKLVSYLLEKPELERLINSKDEDGNTPLHLATMGFHPRVVYILTRENRVKPGLQNKDGLTALDVAEIYAGSSPTFEARLTWMALRYIDAPRSSQSTRKSYVQKEIQRKKYQTTSYKKENRKANNKTELESYKARIDTQLLVATLVATVTFAAGFTLPGGYQQDGKQVGLAVLSEKRAFQVFVICNTAAMYSSILTVVTLIWAHMGDLKLILVSLRFALPLLGFALAMMSLAFMMGVFVALENLQWLSYVVLGMGSVFLAIVLLFFIPLYNPSYIRNPVARFFFSGAFLLLLLVCEKSKMDYA